MNTAARMESNGKPGCIHLSEQTASLLIESGKSNWLEMRKDKIVAKGKGELQTYWLSRNTSSSGGSRTELSESVHDDTDATTSTPEIASSDVGTTMLKLDPKLRRLVSWNVQSLLPAIERLALVRKSRTETSKSFDTLDETASPEKSIPLDEVADTLEICYEVEPTLDSFALLDPEVERELEVYCTTIAAMYHRHPFHNFEHASHVLMSVLKLFARVAKPKGGVEESASKRCARSYGLACDSLVLFACLLAALVHDIDHPGELNERWMQENKALVNLYKQRSVSEQNAFELAWGLLMDNQFATLRRAIYQNKQEKARFRSIFLNAVLATDLFDMEKNAKICNQWERFFGDGSLSSSRNKTPAQQNHCATLVMEELIRASNISHTMQHFQVYRKWNARLFDESYQAYVDGKTDADPMEFWYAQELKFFDNTVIPLARRLQSCGVFGHRKEGNEYLDFAIKNRREWLFRGNAIVAEYRERWNGIEKF